MQSAYMYPNDDSNAVVFGGTSRRGILKYFSLS
jgi:hypothetical protein